MKKKGDFGENIACKHLEDKGYKIIERNWHFKHKEIDIIALDKNQIVFIEVKFRKNTDDYSIFDVISKNKMKYIIDAADEYIKMNNIDIESRFDVIGITYCNKRLDIQHITDAFNAFSI
ncbi:MAG: YraN family protein [Marinilabiliales bacterium]